MKKIKSLILLFVLSTFFLVPIHAENTEYVRDEYDVLSSSEVEELNQQAQRVSQEYGVGVYVRVMHNYSGYNSIEEYAEAVYHQESLGVGTDGECIMLILTMDDRSYDIIAHGTICNRAFTDYGKAELANDSLPYLSDGEYARGFSTFISQADAYLQADANGTPVDTWIPEPEHELTPEERAQNINNMRMIVCLGVCPLIGLVVCFIIKSKNKTSGISHEAVSYITENGLNLTGVQDIFLYRTQTVTRIHHDDDHGGGHMGGTSINSGGFSHSSGKF